MNIAIVTGSGGLIGAEAVRFLSARGLRVIGIDSDMRKAYFGEEASTSWMQKELEATVPNYEHRHVDIRNRTEIDSIFAEYTSDVRVVIHTAAQPSHDWAAKDPYTDFWVNATGTVVLLEATRHHCPDASFIFTSTSKVYGDNVNKLPLIELPMRWEVDPSHPLAEHGIDEQMSVDHTKHSFLGASKLAADILVQEYGRYFGMKTACFRGGCLTGPGQAGTMLHGFLSYLLKCAVIGRQYQVFGYKGKQVRDNIHSYDLVNMFWHYMQAPRPGEVYNAGGGRQCNCSIQEAIELCREMTGREMNVAYCEENRIADHIWYISDTRKFQSHYPGWKYTYDLKGIFAEILASMASRHAVSTGSVG